MAAAASYPLAAAAVEYPMKWPTLTWHDVEVLMAEIAWCIFAFVHPEIMDHLDGAAFPLGVTGIYSGMVLSKGGQRAIQGGSTGDDRIVAPLPAPEVVAVPLSQPVK